MEAKQLIRRAFEQAQRTGKQDWYLMTTAVLKNRLLNLTGGDFNESEYGALNFTDFIRRFNDLVTLDTSRFPPVVELKPDEIALIGRDPTTISSKSSRIRSDLWRAALDRASGGTYVWDSHTQSALIAHHSGDTRPTLPTVDEETDRVWRREFIETFKLRNSIVSTDYEQVNTWAERLLPTSHLPSRLIASWNQFLKEQVQRHLSV